MYIGKKCAGGVEMDVSRYGGGNFQSGKVEYLCWKKMYNSFVRCRERKHLANSEENWGKAEVG
jgi:hypothetical protein